MKWWFLHTGIFITYAAASYLAVLGNYLEVLYGPPKDTIVLKNTIFIYVYGISGGYLGVVYIYDLIMYEYGEPPALSPIFTQAADFFWMACISSISSFIPREPPLHVTTTVVPLDDLDE